MALDVYFKSLDGTRWCNTTTTEWLLAFIAQSQTVDIDALLQRTGITQTTSLDALLQALGLTKTTDIDALLQSLGLTTTTDIDALLQQTALALVSIDAILMRTFPRYQFSADLRTIAFSANARDLTLGR